MPPHGSSPSGFHNNIRLVARWTKALRLFSASSAALR
jgi:hypothetical protein